MFSKRRFQNKYNAKRSNGFASKLENAVYNLLKVRELSGEIKDIKCQQTVVLAEIVRWKIDFSYIDCKTEKLVYAEAKGVSDKVFLMKLKLYKHKPPARLEIYKGNYKRPFLAEVINP
jgi:hypothetical protein